MSLGHNSTFLRSVDACTSYRYMCMWFRWYTCTCSQIIDQHAVLCEKTASIYQTNHLLKPWVVYCASSAFHCPSCILLWPVLSTPSLPFTPNLVNSSVCDTCASVFAFTIEPIGRVIEFVSGNLQQQVLCENLGGEWCVQYITCCL